MIRWMEMLRAIPTVWRWARDPHEPDQECPCGFVGPFDPANNPLRRGAKCPRCGSLEADRAWAMQLIDPQNVH